VFDVVIKFVSGEQRVSSSHELLVEAIEQKKILEEYQENLTRSTGIDEIVIEEQLKEIL